MDRTGKGHTFGGQARIRSHRSLELLVGWGRQVNMKTTPWGACRPVIGSDPSRISCHQRQVFEGLAGDVAFQTAHDLCRVAAFVPAACHVGAGLLVG